MAYNMVFSIGTTRSTKINYDFGAANEAKSSIEEMAETFHGQVFESYREAEDILGFAFGGDAAVMLQRKMEREEEKLKNTYRTLKEAGEAMDRASAYARKMEEKAKREIMRRTHR